MATKKTTTATKTRRGAPTKYTREVILRFIKFMMTKGSGTVRGSYKAYNKTNPTVKVKHIPMLVAMAREGLNMTKIVTESGALVANVRKAVARLK